MTINYKLTNSRRHVVLLGAGASRAAFPNGEANGKKLPLMNDFISTVDGLPEYLAKKNIQHDGNIEQLYSKLHKVNNQKEVLSEIENIIFRYFSNLTLPSKPTLYDHLILSLRSKDVIATFNWDPFLLMAYNRVGSIIGQEHLPHLSFLHGNVALGFCVDKSHQKVIVGSTGQICRCGKPFQKSKLLYPVEKKEYSTDRLQMWQTRDLKLALNDAYLFTIFGYSAPVSDIEAIEMLQEGWGPTDKRNLEQIEIIDIAPSNQIEKSWGNFIFSDHVTTINNLYDSYLSSYPRRSCDAFWDMTMDLIPRPQNALDRTATWNDLKKWVTPYIDSEKSSDFQ